MVLRLVLAAVLGGMLGLEREYDGQDAGFRTHVMLVLGTALFSVVSVGAFHDFVAPRNSTNVVVDVTRIAAYVAPGVGFIGGGAIIKHRGRVSGLTTAATLWTGAAIGVASGLGAWQAAVATTLIALIALEGLQPLSKAVDRVAERKHAVLAIDVDEDCDLSTVLATLQEHLTGSLRRLTFGRGPDSVGTFTVRTWDRLTPQQTVQLADLLRRIEGVRSVGTRDQGRSAEG
jgi:putative Mg2+ transporter-C (MgtC) family protein